jgi:hypothetical protein
MSGNIDLYYLSIPRVSSNSLGIWGWYNQATNCNWIVFGFSHVNLPHIYNGSFTKPKYDKYPLQSCFY